MNTVRLKHITFFCLIGLLLSGLFTACSKLSVKPNNQLIDSTSIIHVKGWQQAASLPSSRAYATAFTLNGNGYVAGGISNMGDPHAPGYDDMYMYDATANRWIKKAGMPALDIVKGGRRHPFSLMINNTIYGGGGLSLNGVPGNDVNAYDPASDKWNLVAKWNGWYGFDRSVGANSGNRGFIFSFSQENESVYEFDPVAKTVTIAPFAGHMPSSLWTESNWYGTNGTSMLKGYSGGTYYMGVIDTINYKMNYYPAIQNMTEYPLQSSVLLKGVYYKDNIYCVFGNAGNLYRFNLVTGLCQNLISQDLGVTQGAFAFIADGKFYVAGGNNGIFTPSTDKVWMIDLEAY